MRQQTTEEEANPDPAPLESTGCSCGTHASKMGPAPTEGEMNHQEMNLVQWETPAPGPALPQGITTPWGAYGGQNTIGGGAEAVLYPKDSFLGTSVG